MINTVLDKQERSQKMKIACQNLIGMTYSHLHRLQTSPSAHSGAVSASNIASASLTAGNFQPSAFIKFNVS